MCCSGKNRRFLRKTIRQSHKQSLACFICSTRMSRDTIYVYPLFSNVSSQTKEKLDVNNPWVNSSQPCQYIAIIFQKSSSPEKQRANELWLRLVSLRPWAYHTIFSNDLRMTFAYLRKGQIWSFMILYLEIC